MLNQSHFDSFGGSSTASPAFLKADDGSNAFFVADAARSFDTGLAVGLADALADWRAEVERRLERAELLATQAEQEWAA